MPGHAPGTVTSHWTIGHEPPRRERIPESLMSARAPAIDPSPGATATLHSTTSATVTDRPESLADESTAEQAREERRSDVWIVTIATVILSFTVVATAWCSYQSTLWGGIQAASYNRAGGLRVKATRAMTTAGQRQIIDVGVFLRWVEAYAQGDTRYATFLRERFRPEFRPAFEAWLASRPLKNPSAASTPFALPEYRVALLDSSQQYEEESVRLFDEGQRANQIGDRYMLDTVLFALALFFASSAQQGRHMRVRVATLVLSLVITVMAVGDLIAHPRARTPLERLPHTEVERTGVSAPRDVGP